jgi:hypothetical protein
MSDDLFADIHRELAQGRERKRAARKRERDYDYAAWHKRRAQFIADNPDCLCCASVGVRGVPATIADHVEPLTMASADFLTAPLQPACLLCHQSVKRTLENAYRRGEIKAADLRLDSAVAKRLRGALLGCDRDGMPLDPTHPWRAELIRRQNKTGG